MLAAHYQEEREQRVIHQAASLRPVWASAGRAAGVQTEPFQRRWGKHLYLTQTNKQNHTNITRESPKEYGNLFEVFPKYFVVVFSVHILTNEDSKKKTFHKLGNVISLIFTYTQYSPAKKLNSEVRVNKPCCALLAWPSPSARAETQNGHQRCC